MKRVQIVKRKKKELISSPWSVFWVLFLLRAFCNEIPVFCQPCPEDLLWNVDFTDFLVNSIFRGIICEIEPKVGPFSKGFSSIHSKRRTHQ